MGQAVLIAESNMHHVPDFADRLYVIERGEVIFSGTPAEVAKNPAVARVAGATDEQVLADIQVDGQPTVTTKVGFLPPPYFEATTIEEFMDLGHIMVAVPAINAIPAVVAAAPGIATSATSSRSPHSAGRRSTRRSSRWRRAMRA